jgi:hypothetical protein
LCAKVVKNNDLEVAWSKVGEGDLVFGGLTWKMFLSSKGNHIPKMQLCLTKSLRSFKTRALRTISLYMLHPSLAL